MNRSVNHSSLTTLLLIAGFVTACSSETSSPDGPRVAQLDGRAIEIMSAGSGDATVVFEAGLGADWTSWEPVRLEVMRKARVFGYSRPGYGKSAPTTTPREPSQIVEELRALLAAEGYTPPYILVGHSFGGAYMELFAKRHPHEVAGLVLVDPRHRDFTSACEAAELQACTIPSELVKTLPQVVQAEIAGYAEASAQIDAAGAFGTYPVRVLTATTHSPSSPEWEALWMSMLASLAGEAADGEQVVFDGASHNLELERPLEVAEVILDIVETLQ